MPDVYVLFILVISSLSLDSSKSFNLFMFITLLFHDNYFLLLITYVEVVSRNNSSKDK